MPQLELLSWYFGLIVMVAILWRLFSLGLLRRYPALACCLGFQLIRAIPLLTLSVDTDVFALTYFATLPFLLITYVCVALEIYSQAFEAYRGLFIVGRRVMLGVLGVSAVVAIITHLGELKSSDERFQTIRAVLLVESAVCLMLLIFLVAVAAFLVWYPANVRKNLLLYSFSFSVYTASQCTTIFLRNSDPTSLTRIASLARLIVDDLCLLALAVLFQLAWEVDRRPSAASLPTGQRQRVLSQLSQLNAALESSGKSTHSP